MSTAPLLRLLAIIVVGIILDYVFGMSPPISLAFAAFSCGLEAQLCGEARRARRPNAHRRVLVLWALAAGVCALVSHPLNLALEIVVPIRDSDLASTDIGTRSLLLARLVACAAVSFLAAAAMLRLRWARQRVDNALAQRPWTALAGSLFVLFLAIDFVKEAAALAPLAAAFYTTLVLWGLLHAWAALLANYRFDALTLAAECPADGSSTGRTPSQ